MTLRHAALLAASIAALAAMRHSAARVDPMSYFQKLVPVLKHDRCMNCHGGTDPLTGRNHGGGVVDLNEIQCSNCHDDDWGDHIAPADVWFVGKDAEALCAQLSRAVMVAGVGDFLRHLAEDKPIAHAFAGRMGNARDASLPAAEPPMKQPAFLDAAVEWLNAGNGGCIEEGRIRRRQQIANNEAQQLGPGHTQTIQQTARREVVIELRNGQYTAFATAEGDWTHKQVIEGDGCITTIWSIARYSGTNAGPATVRTRVQPSGKYSIEVSGPRETYRQTTTGTSTSTCGLPPMNSGPDETELEWPPWSFTMEGQLTNPNDRRRLVGVEGEILIGPGDTPEQNSFLSVSAQNGGSIPITVRTDWNLLYGR